MVEQSMDSIGCRACRGKTKVISSRAHKGLGFKALVRRRGCVDCGARYSTVEIPKEYADDMFAEDFWEGFD